MLAIIREHDVVIFPYKLVLHHSSVIFVSIRHDSDALHFLYCFFQYFGCFKRDTHTQYDAVGSTRWHIWKRMGEETLRKWQQQTPVTERLYHLDNGNNENYGCVVCCQVLCVVNYCVLSSVVKCCSVLFSVVCCEELLRVIK